MDVLLQVTSKYIYWFLTCSARTACCLLAPCQLARTDPLLPLSLASTFVLTRISVVHHAALNCIRRIFAIIVTSFAFSVPITLVGAMGICVSFGGFMAFTRYKIKRQSRPKPISTLLPISAA